MRREPIGVCAAIVPWNFPLLMATWKLAMALATGNTIVLKPSPETPLSALELGKIIAASRVPAGVVNVIAGPDRAVGEMLVRHPDVDRVAFTGSTPVGKEILKNGADTLKRVSLELGGKSANIVLHDADIELAVDGAVWAAFLHTGQVCESGTRLLLPESLHDAFVTRLVERVRALQVGHPLDPRTKVGPVINAAQRDRIERYVAMGKKEGARLVCGGERPVMPGLRGGLLRPAHGVRRRTPEDGDRARRDLRTGPLGHPVPRRRRGDRHRERLGLRPRRRRLVARSRSARARSPIGCAPERCGSTTGTSSTTSRRSADTSRAASAARWGTSAWPSTPRSSTSTSASRPTPTRRPATACSSRAVARCRTSTSRARACSPGPGSLARLYAELGAMGKERALVVTDEGVVKAGLLARLREVLGPRIVAVFDAVTQDSGIGVVDAAAALGRSSGADVIISLGGGSCIDTAKATAVALANGWRAIESIGMYHLAGPPMTHIAIPTTAGTGSEVTNVAVIKNEHVGTKAYILDPLVAPDLAILDPTLIVGLPPRMTAATGLDALTHAVEAYTGRAANSMSDSQALHAIRLIARWLPRAVSHGSDLEARANMQTAATLAGLGDLELDGRAGARDEPHDRRPPRGAARDRQRGALAPRDAVQRRPAGERVEARRRGAGAGHRRRCAGEGRGRGGRRGRRAPARVQSPDAPLGGRRPQGRLAACAAIAVTDLAAASTARRASVGEIEDLYRAAW